MIIDEKTLLFVENNINSDVVKLALQKEKYTDVDFTWAIQQIAARKKHKEKYPALSQNLNFLFPVNLSIEQSSSEEAAQFKTTLLKGKTLIDLTAGFGIDVLTLAPHFEKVIAVEPNRELCDLLLHNARVLQASHIEVVNDTAEHFLEKFSKETKELVFYIDPSRRDEKGTRLNELEAYQPSLQFLQYLATYPNASLFIKLSPMLDIRELQRLIPNMVAIYVIAVRGECKELLLHCSASGALNSDNTPIYAVNIVNKRYDIFSFSAEEATFAPTAQEVLSYVYEPNAAIMKAGAYHAIGNYFNIEKLDRNTHLFTSNEELPHFYGKRFKVIEVLNFEKTHLKRVKGNHFQLICKNFPTPIEQLRKQLKINDKGEQCLIATTVNGARVLLICEKPSIY